jgi:hypothetical protein
MTTAEPPFVLAIDVGSPTNIGWATASASVGHANFHEMVDRLAARLVAEGRAAIGFEAPIWTPRRWELGQFTGARGNLERTLRRAWSASAGARVLAAGLGLMPWTFARIAHAAPGARATVSLERWRERGGLFVWEAFVSGNVKRETHAADAIVALDTFMARWPDLQSDIPPEPALNLAVATAMSVGLAVEPDEIGEASIVLAAPAVRSEAAIRPRCLSTVAGNEGPNFRVRAPPATRVAADLSKAVFRRANRPACAAS